VSAPGGPARAPVGDLGYGEAAAELDEIIAELDRGVVDVDLLGERLVRAVEIVEELERRIRGAREQVGAILPRLQQVASAEPPPVPDRE
jgi:exonuclease VII small subunit